MLLYRETTMPRRYLRKWMPAQSDARKHPLLWMLGSAVFNKRLWHLNRHSAAFGAACGVFWAWICCPVQTVGAVASSFLGRGNVAISMLFTWISNPLTWVPCFWLAYEVGLPLTPAERIDFRGVVGRVMDGGIVGGTKVLLAELPQLYPMYVGGVLLGIVTGLLAYLLVSVTWRWHVGRRWRKRHAVRQRTNPKLKIGGGLASLARRRVVT